MASTVSLGSKLVVVPLSKGVKKAISPLMTDSLACYHALKIFGEIGETTGDPNPWPFQQLAFDYEPPISRRYCWYVSLLYVGK